jgi:hypothetical protein
MEISIEGAIVQIDMYETIQIRAARPNQYSFSTQGAPPDSIRGFKQMNPDRNHKRSFNNRQSCANVGGCLLKVQVVASEDEACCHAQSAMTSPCSDNQQLGTFPASSTELDLDMVTSFPMIASSTHSQCHRGKYRARTQLLGKVHDGRLETRSSSVAPPR